MKKESPFTPEEIDALPTILDVVEKISAIENDLVRPVITQVPSPSYFDEGRYSFVSERQNRNVVHLMPMSQSPFRYYRGQSTYYEPCLATLFRGKKKGEEPTDEEVIAKLIKVCEFVLLLRKHPVYYVVAQNIMANPVALAQHYGLSTEYLDVTNSKWVAAFFASSGYDWNTDTYYPVGRNYGDGYGVMYISKDYIKGNLPEDFFDKNVVIGYQYFARPTKQSSFGYGMTWRENFNDCPYFEKVFFKHDIEASKVVFDMSYRQNRFIPKDKLSKLSRKIQVSDEVTRDAVKLCLERYCNDREMAFMDEVCKKQGLKIREDNTPIAAFEEADLAADWKEWMEFGKADIEARTLPIIPVATLSLDELDKNDD